MTAAWPDCGEVHLWRSCASHAAPLIQAARPSPDEEAVLSRFVRPQDRQERRTARALTRFVLSRYLNVNPSAIEIERDSRGKPFLPLHADLSFNLSHSNGHVFLAVASRQGVGVDLETRGALKDLDSIVDGSFSDREREYLHNCTIAKRPDEILQIWTRKEAVLKAIGLGLHCDPRRINVSSSPHGPRRASFHSTTIEWLDIELGPPWKSAVAKVGSLMAIRCFCLGWPKSSHGGTQDATANWEELEIAKNPPERLSRRL